MKRVYFPHESAIAFTHEQNIICANHINAVLRMSRTLFVGSDRQSFADQVVGSQPMERKKWIE